MLCHAVKRGTSTAPPGRPTRAGELCGGLCFAPCPGPPCGAQGRPYVGQGAPSHRPGPGAAPSTGSGGGAHAGRLHAQGSSPRMAAHRAQLHIGAVSFLFRLHHADAAAQIQTASTARTARRTRGSWAVELTGKPVRETGAARAAQARPRSGPWRTLPPSRPRGCPPTGSGSGAPAGRLHVQGSGPEDGGTPGTDPRRGGAFPAISSARTAQDGRGAVLISFQKLTLDNALCFPVN